MSYLGTSKGLLEVGKFALYVGIPIALMYNFTYNGKNLQRVLGGRSYVVYPPDSLRPLTEEEMNELSGELARKNRPSSQL